MSDICGLVDNVEFDFLWTENFIVVSRRTKIKVLHPFSSYSSYFAVFHLFNTCINLFIPVSFISSRLIYSFTSTLFYSCILW